VSGSNHADCGAQRTAAQRLIPFSRPPLGLLQALADLERLFLSRLNTTTRAGAPHATFRPTTVPILKMTGSTSSTSRHRLVREFQNLPGPAIFLLSTRACGIGINLTAASRAIICDSIWNPMWASQAAARCHRLGQTEPVQIYRLVFDGAFDHKVAMRALEKEATASVVVDARAVGAILRPEDWETWAYTPSAAAAGGAAAVEDAPGSAADAAAMRDIADGVAAACGRAALATVRRVADVMTEDRSMKLSKRWQRKVRGRLLVSRPRSDSGPSARRPPSRDIPAVHANAGDASHR
jgi:Helicase conserved C-terminal domain